MESGQVIIGFLVTHRKKYVWKAKVQSEKQGLTSLKKKPADCADWGKSRIILEKTGGKNTIFFLGGKKGVDDDRRGGDRGTAPGGHQRKGGGGVCRSTIL